jgi:hypothetical protein
MIVNSTGGQDLPSFYHAEGQLACRKLCLAKYKCSSHDKVINIETNQLVLHTENKSS